MADFIYKRKLDKNRFAKTLPEILGEYGFDEKEYRKKLREKEEKKSIDN